MFFLMELSNENKNVFFYASQILFRMNKGDSKHQLLSLFGSSLVQNS